MRRMDWVKAVAAGVCLLIVDLVIAFAAVYVYAMVVAPGHEREYYAVAGIPIARWSTRTAGTALVLGAAWLLARRNRRRNPYLFAMVMMAAYTLADGAAAGFVGVASADFAVTIGLKLAGALLGAWLGKSGPSRAATR